MSKASKAVPVRQALAERYNNPEYRRMRQAALAQRIAEYEQLRKPRPKPPTPQDLDLGDDEIPY
jgi:hypothetical protein